MVIFSISWATTKASSTIHPPWYKPAKLVVPHSPTRTQKKKSMLKSTFTCTYLQKKVTRRLEFKQLEHKAWAEPALRLAHDCPKGLLAGAKTVIKNQSVASFLQWQYCKNLPLSVDCCWQKHGKHGHLPVTFRPLFFCQTLNSMQTIKRSVGGDIH